MALRLRKSEQLSQFIVLASNEPNSNNRNDATQGSAFQRWRGDYHVWCVTLSEGEISSLGLRGGSASGALGLEKLPHEIQFCSHFLVIQY